MSEMGAADFKAHCLQVMEKVRRTRQEVVITKRGVPVAKLVPVNPPKKKNIFGCMAGEMQIVDETPVYTEEDWKEFERLHTEAGKTTMGLYKAVARRASLDGQH